MTVHPGSSPAASARAGDVILDGLFTGMIGALVVALWFLVLDLSAGRPLHTPAFLGSVLLHGGGAAPVSAASAPMEIAAYTAFHFVAFIVIGVLFSWAMTLFDRFPIMFFVILVAFLCLQVGFFAMNAVLGVGLTGQIQIWSVLVANVLAATAMAWYQWRRHPHALRGIERLWEHES